MEPLVAQFNKNWMVDFNTTLQGYTFLGVWFNDELHVYFDEVHILTMPMGTQYSELINAIYLLINKYHGKVISKRAIAKIMLPSIDVDAVLQATLDYGHWPKLNK
jgi:hypothetical protein